MIIDILLLIIAGWGFYQGYSRGIIKTVFTVFSIIFGLMAAFKFAPAATRFLETAFKTESALTFVAGFLLSFVVTMILIRLMARFFEKALQTANINVINKFAGGLLMTSLYTLVFSMMVWFGDKAHIISPELASESATHNFLIEFPTKMKSVYEFVKPTFQEFWAESVKFMDKLEDESVKQNESEPTIFDIPEEQKKLPD